MRHGEMTAYPKIFNDYWGFSPVTPEVSATMSEVYENRNQFVREFNILRGLSTGTSMFWGFYGCDLDHLEAYRTTGGWVLAAHKYDHEVSDAAWAIGFRPYADLYGFGTQSFVLVITDDYESPTGLRKAIATYKYLKSISFNYDDRNPKVGEEE